MVFLRELRGSSPEPRASRNSPFFSFDTSFRLACILFCFLLFIFDSKYSCFRLVYHTVFSSITRLFHQKVRVLEKIYTNLARYLVHYLIVPSRYFRIGRIFFQGFLDLLSLLKANFSMKFSAAVNWRTVVLSHEVQT